MKILVFGFLTFISVHAYSQHLALEEISLSIDEMVRSKIISENEGKKAKIRLRSNNKEFLQTTNRMPASLGNQLIDSHHGPDLSKAQMKQIEKEIDVIFNKVSD